MGNLAHDFFPRSEVPSVTALRYHPALVAQLAALRCAGGGAAGQAVTSGPERLFLGREAKVRRLTNAAALCAALQRHGVAKVETVNLSLPDQIRMMANAKVIIAQSGAQLANMLFAPPGCRVFVLASDAPGTNYRLWSALGQLLGHEVTTIVGPHQKARLPRGVPLAHADFSVSVSHVLAFLEPGPQSIPTTAQHCLDALAAMADKAEVLTGAWAVKAGPTDAGFDDHLGALRRAAVAAVQVADEGDLRALLAHRFFKDFTRSLWSGFASLPVTNPAEQALAAQVVTALRRLADAPENNTISAQSEPVLAGSGQTPAGMRRLLMLAMLLVPNWQVRLPRDPGALAKDVRDRWILWAMVPPFLGRAGEDAAWVAHVEHMLDWFADRLGPETPFLLRRRLAGWVKRLDLGQLLLVDAPLGSVQRARNRVLEAVALRHGAPRVFLRPGLVNHAEIAKTEPLLSVKPRAARCRIGILCRSFEKGPDSEAVLAFFQDFDPDRYEIFVYSMGVLDRVIRQDAAFERLFAAKIAHKRILPADPAAIRTRILADDLDVFLFANATTFGVQPLDLALYHRVAPVQVALNAHLPMPLGYPSFDAFLTGAAEQDCNLDQAGSGEYLLRVAGPVIRFQAGRDRPAVSLPDRAALGLAPSDIVMMTAGSMQKLRYQCLFVMMQAVVAVPGAILLVAPYNPGWAARSLAFAFNRQIVQTAAEVGLDMARIRVLGELSVAETEAALACADIYLNPFPHGGATMTHLALRHGVPPVTLRRRSTRSIDQFVIAALGFEALIADSPAAYIALVASLAGDRGTLRAVSARLVAAARDPGFEANPGYSRDMQRAIEALMHSCETGADAKSAGRGLWGANAAFRE
ncbi:MAG: glycosyltransferase 61 family protein [Paracoccaceae bacterium]|nr:glycosyltransferase 61 family protein [Paracoccaceae bacterium]